MEVDCAALGSELAQPIRATIRKTGIQRRIVGSMVFPHPVVQQDTPTPEGGAWVTVNLLKFASEGEASARGIIQQSSAYLPRL